MTIPQGSLSSCLTYSPYNDQDLTSSLSNSPLRFNFSTQEFSDDQDLTERTIAEDQIKKFLGAPAGLVNLVNDDEEAFFVTEEGFKKKYEEAISAYQNFLKEAYPWDDAEELKWLLSSEEHSSTIDLPHEVRKKIASLKCASLGRTIWPDEKPSFTAGDPIELFKVLISELQSKEAPYSAGKQEALGQFINFFATSVIDKYCTSSNSIFELSLSPFFNRLRRLNQIQLDELDSDLKKIYEPGKTCLYQVTNKSTIVSVDYIHRVIRSSIQNVEMEAFVDEATNLASTLAEDEFWFSDFSCTSSLENFCHSDSHQFQKIKQKIKKGAITQLVTCLYRRKKGYLPCSSDVLVDLKSFFKQKKPLKIVKNFQQLFCFQILDVLWKGSPPFAPEGDNSYLHCLKFSIKALGLTASQTQIPKKAITDFAWMTTDFLHKKDLKDVYKQYSYLERLVNFIGLEKEINKLINFRNSTDSLVKLRSLDLLATVVDNLKDIIAIEGDKSLADKLSEILKKAEESLPEDTSDWVSLFSEVGSRLPLMSKAGQQATCYMAGLSFPEETEAGCSAQD